MDQWKDSRTQQSKLVVLQIAIDDKNKEEVYTSSFKAELMLCGEEIYIIYALPVLP